MWPTVAPSPTAPCSSAGTHHQHAPIVAVACAISGALPQQPGPQRRGQVAAAALQRTAPRPLPPASSPPWPQRTLEQRRQRAVRLPACAAAAPEAAEGGYETDNDGQTVEQRLKLVQNMVATLELLVPYDASAVNMALILWCVPVWVFLRVFRCQTHARLCLLCQQGRHPQHPSKGPRAAGVAAQLGVRRWPFLHCRFLSLDKKDSLATPANTMLLAFGVSVTWRSCLTPPPLAAPPQRHQAAVAGGRAALPGAQAAGVGRHWARVLAVEGGLAGLC